MYRLIYWLAVLTGILLFVFGTSVLDLIGWSYTSAGGSIITKIHPSFYVLLVAAMLKIAAGSPEARAEALRPRNILFAIAALMILVRAILIVRSGVTEGEFSAVIVTWVSPALLLIVLAGIRRDDLNGMGVLVRGFFILDSLMALLERVVGHRFIPGLIDKYMFEDRATALLAHPLNGAMLTGLMIVFLISARRSTQPLYIRLPEILLHIGAMFAFGGRSALVFTAAVVVASGLVARRKPGQRNLSVVQRAMPFIVIGVGLILVTLPIPFVDATLDRFSNDDKSSLTRNAAVHMLTMLDPGQLLWGIDANQRHFLQDFLRTPAGIEISWISLAVTYGLVVTIPLLIMLPVVMLGNAQRFDRSAFYMSGLFLLVTIGSLSIGSKSVLISQALFMIYTLCQPRLVGAAGEAGGTGPRRKLDFGQLAPERESIA